MEHLPLPTNPQIKHLDIPFLASPYDAGEFLTYPERHGWEITQNDDGGTIYWQHGVRAPAGEVGAFLQTWLFFGLLFSFTGQEQSFDAFKRHEVSGGPFLSTRSLTDIIGPWTAHMDQQDWTKSEVKLRDWGERLYSHLLKARETTLLVKFTSQYESISLVCTSLAVLAEYLLQALKNIYIRRGVDSPIEQSWRIVDFIDCGKPLIDRMIAAGWCPSNIARLDAERPLGIDNLWVYANMIPPRANSVHTSCSKGYCTAMNVQRGLYKQVHEVDECSCSSIEAPVDIMGSIFQAGKFPLMTLRKGFLDVSGGSRLQVEACEPDTEFVAISHVWSDGHGNPVQNSLPSCFVEFLVEIANNVTGRKESAAPIWIDTLCVPRQPETLRQEALKRLKDPFKLARHTVVLDSYLGSLQAEPMAEVEIVARIMACGWMQRLWTLQEGRLGRHVWFKFQDRLVELDKVVERWKLQFTRIPCLPSQTVGLHTLTSYTGSAISVLPGHDDALKDVPYSRVALQSRSTSVATDEALCLASIMDQDIAKIVETPPEKRMGILWSSLPKVPCGLAFSKATRKLDQPGRRWAPASFMGEMGNRMWLGLGGEFSNISGKVSGEGFVVDSPAMMFKFAPAFEERLPSFISDALYGSTTTVLHRPHIWLFDGIEKWYDCLLESSWHQNPPGAGGTVQNVSIILCHVTKSSPPSEAEVKDETEWRPGILVTHSRADPVTSPPSSSSSAIPVKAYRHVSLRRRIGLIQETLNALKRHLNESISSASHDENSQHKALIEWRELTDSQLKDRTVDFLRHDQKLRDLIVKGNKVYSLDGSEESDEKVQQGALELLRFMLEWWPDVTVEKTSNAIRWCID